MIFSIQHHLEDDFNRRALTDPDQYAVRVANLYDRSRRGRTDEQFLTLMAHLRTAFFRANRNLVRRQFERALLTQLDRRFKKKLAVDTFLDFPGGVMSERAQLRRKPRLTISRILAAFKHAVESRTIDSFWVSRIRGQLRQRPEKIAQALLAAFAKGVVGDRGLVQRELSSGIGFVDVSIVLSATVPHLAELKIIKSRLVGVSQLETYMHNENRREGWLVLFDARSSSKKTATPKTIPSRRGTIRVVTIDINPTAPHKR